MTYLLSAIIIACKFSTCYYLPYSEYTNNPTACVTLPTRIISISRSAGWINAQVVSCSINGVRFT